MSMPTDYSLKLVFSYAFLTLVAIAIIIAVSRGFLNVTDYGAWRGDWRLFYECTGLFQLEKCGEISKFPLAYMINSIWSAENPRMLHWANLFMLTLPVLILWFLRGWKLAVVAGSMYWLAIVFSPLPAYYINSGALELQAGIIGGIFISSLTLLVFHKSLHSKNKWIPLLIISGILLVLYKDTLPITMAMSFALTLAFRYVAILISSSGEKSSDVNFSALWLGIVAVIIGLTLNVGYNLFKYNSLWPVAYLSENALTSPSVPVSAEFLLGSILSPNGGVAVFWALAIVTLLLGLRLLGFVPYRFTVWFAVISAIVSCVAFARWWAPFGWDSWGNRLMIQPMLALLVAMFLSIEPSSTAFSFLRKKRSIVISLLFASVLITSSYYVAIPYIAERGKAWETSLWPGPACNKMRQILQSKSIKMSFWKSNTYYRCARERMLYIPTL